MTLVDANILMYAAGGEHQHQARSVAFVESLATQVEAAAIDAETLQEILHRYRAVGRWQLGSQIYTLARRMFPAVLPITAEITDHARALLELYPPLIARDAIHAAVVQIYGLDSICSFDRDFDRIAGLRRIEP